MNYFELCMRAPLNSIIQRPVGGEKDLRKDREWLANHISDIFNPFYLNMPLVLLVALTRSANQVKALGLALIIILSSSVLPMLEIGRRIRKGDASDPHLSRREERIKPLVFGLISTLGGLALIYFLKAPPVLLAMMVAGLLSGMVLVGITSFWKISLHSAGVSGAATALSILYGAFGFPLWVLVLMVWWARLALKKHTIAQVLAGSAVSITMTASVFYRFGLVG